MIWVAIGIITIIFLIGISAFFSGSEMAFVSVSRAMVREKAKNENAKAKLLDGLLKKPDDVVSAIVVGNNLVNILASVMAGSIAVKIFGDIGIGIATALMTLALVIFGEVTPKAFGIKNEKMALKIAKPLYIITKIFYPISVFLATVSNGIIKIAGGERKNKTAVTEGEIRAMLELGEEDGAIEIDEKEMVKEVLDFDDTMAWEVKVPREEIVYLNENESIDALIKKSIETGYSRFPIYRDNIDDIVGMVHVKDTLTIEDKNTPLKETLRDILKIRAGMKADDVLREMQRRKIHLAILQGEDGRTLGLVTLEDLIEEVFGEISDEHDIK
ncbi:MAG: hemolysin family protein [Candidatus Thermoplasmatota archaeon]|nr:hemolysin family protein [Candidatus Thermoplasmatota archaeon]